VTCKGTIAQAFAEYDGGRNVIPREVHRRMAHIMDIDEESLITQVQQNLPEPKERGPRSLELWEVKSYVAKAGTKTSTFGNVVVPAFAAHWGVVVGPTIYHLVFQNNADLALDSDDLSRRGKPIEFTFYRWKRDTKRINDFPVVGRTQYNHQQLCDIGDELIRAFGDYHRLFWNCQVFAKCFLRLITGGQEFDTFSHPMRKSDDRLTSADATHLFLCGIVVTAPAATTLKITHEMKRKRVEASIQEFMSEINIIAGHTGTRS